MNILVSFALGFMLSSVLYSILIIAHNKKSDEKYPGAVYCKKCHDEIIPLCPDCSGNDLEPDYIELLNNEIKWHEENIVQDETEKQSAFIKGIKQARFLIAKAERELTKRAPDVCPSCAGEKQVIGEDGTVWVCGICGGTGKRR